MNELMIFYVMATTVFSIVTTLIIITDRNVHGRKLRELENGIINHEEEINAMLRVGIILEDKIEKNTRFRLNVENAIKENNLKYKKGNK